jgi:membrane protein YdbS with pleckstrin-like domain
METLSKSPISKKVDKEVLRFLSDKEQLVASTRQHEIVLFKWIFYILFGYIAFLIIFALLGNVLFFVALAVLMLAVMSIIFYVISWAYKRTLMVATNCSIVYVQQRGLFFHKVSRLSMADVEDVSSSQNGILPSILNFGTLKIQTAGELPNFTFRNCPQPVHMTEIILKARDQYNNHHNHNNP